MRFARRPRPACLRSRARVRRGRRKGVESGAPSTGLRHGSRGSTCEFAIPDSSGTAVLQPRLGGSSARAAQPGRPVRGSVVYTPSNEVSGPSGAVKMTGMADYTPMLFHLGQAGKGGARPPVRLNSFSTPGAGGLWDRSCGRAPTCRASLHALLAQRMCSGHCRRRSRIPPELAIPRCPCLRVNGGDLAVALHGLAPPAQPALEPVVHPAVVMPLRLDQGRPPEQRRDLAQLQAIGLCPEHLQMLFVAVPFRSRPPIPLPGEGPPDTLHNSVSRAMSTGR